MSINNADADADASGLLKNDEHATGLAPVPTFNVAASSPQETPICFPLHTMTPCLGHAARALLVEMAEAAVSIGAWSWCSV